MHDLLLAELFDVEYYHDLEMWVRGHSRSLKMVQFDGPYTTFYWSAIVTIALSFLVCEMQQVIGRKSQKNYTPPAFSAPELGDPVGILRNCL